MKKSFISLLVLMALISACTVKVQDNSALVEQSKEETTIASESVKAEERKVNDKLVDVLSENKSKLDVNKKFSYTGKDKYVKAITDDLVSYADTMFGNQDAVEIPTPIIIKVVDDDKNDIRVYGNFEIYGYTLDGTIFNMKNGGSNPGCYHLKEEDNNVVVVSLDIAEDGSRNWESLVDICGGDENLAKEILNKDTEAEDEVRLEYAKMYADANGIKFSGIKDYGWPVILLDSISDAEFVYNFYHSYFAEVRQDDVLNDMPERIENLKKKYMTEEAIEKINALSFDIGADMVMSAQDVTDTMNETLRVEDLGKGTLKVSYDGGDGTTDINVKVSKVSGSRKITEIYYDSIK